MEEETKVVLEATVLNEKENSVLEIMDPEAKIKTVGEVTSNITKVKEQALAMKDHYSKIVVADDNLNDAKDEKANINKVASKIAEYRKNIVAEFKKPIETFENLAKETEKVLKETYDMINVQCNAYDEKKKNDIREKYKDYFNEYKASKNLGFTQYSDMNQKVGSDGLTEKGSLKKSLMTEIENFIDNIVKDVDTIASMDNAEEILAEYMKDRNLARSIKDVQDRHKMIETISKSKDELLQVNEIKVVEPVEVEVLKAPVEQNSIKKLKRARFEIIYEDDQVAIDLVKFLKERGINYAIIKQ